MVLFLLCFGNTIADTKFYNLELIIIFLIFFWGERTNIQTLRASSGKERRTYTVLNKSFGKLKK